MQILQASFDKLGAAQSMTFSAIEVNESPSRQGDPLGTATSYQVALQRPDKLRVFTPGDGPDRRFYYDGKTITAIAPNENVYATKPASGTVSSVLEAAYKQYRTYFPFTDLIVANPLADLKSALKQAYYVTRSNAAADAPMDVVALISNDVFVQMWIGVDDKLPHLIRAVYYSDPARMRHELALRDWQIDPVLPADTFVAQIPAGAKPIEFAPYGSVKKGQASK